MKRKRDLFPKKIFSTYLPATSKFCAEVNARLATVTTPDTTIVNQPPKTANHQLTENDITSIADTVLVNDSDAESNVSRILDTPRSDVDWDAIPGSNTNLAYDVDHISDSDNDSSSGFSPRR